LCGGDLRRKRRGSGQGRGIEQAPTIDGLPNDEGIIEELSARTAHIVLPSKLFWNPWGFVGHDAGLRPGCQDAANQTQQAAQYCHVREKDLLQAPCDSYERVSSVVGEMRTVANLF
jgi:hypothetical protein